MKTARQLVLEVLIDVERGNWSNRSLDLALEESDLEARDRRFATQLVYGVLDNQILLDYQIRKYSKTRLGKLHVEILTILRMGFYQILYLNTVPDASAVDESVKLAKQNKGQFSGFVNGILRQFLRDGKKVQLPDPSKSPSDYLSVKYSHPLWIVNRWMKRFGKDQAEALLEMNNTSPKVVLRTNTLRISRTKLVQVLHEEGITASFGKYNEEAVVIEGMDSSIRDLQAYKDGLFTVQDEASMMVAHVAKPSSGMRVLDTCSAPGGKVTHIAQLMEDKGDILSRDIYEQKLVKINGLVRRLGLKSVKVEQFDATVRDESLVDQMDLVLVDAPCSGLGIIRRKPDIRFNRQEKDLKELVALQRQILQTAAQYVRPGGTLIYSTCTTEPEENSKQMKRFLKQHPDFQPDMDQVDLPEEIEVDQWGGFSLLPHIHGTDGFFICRLKRKA